MTTEITRRVFIKNVASLSIDPFGFINAVDSKNKISKLIEYTSLTYDLAFDVMDYTHNHPSETYTVNAESFNINNLIAKIEKKREEIFDLIECNWNETFQKLITKNVLYCVNDSKVLSSINKRSKTYFELSKFAPVKSVYIGKIIRKEKIRFNSNYFLTGSESNDFKGISFFESGYRYDSIVWKKDKLNLIIDITALQKYINKKVKEKMPLDLLINADYGGCDFWHYLASKKGPEFSKEFNLCFVDNFFRSNK